MSSKDDIYEQYYQYLKNYEKDQEEVPKANKDASCDNRVKQLEQQLEQCRQNAAPRLQQSRKITRPRLTYKPSDEWLEKNFMRKKKNNGSLTDFGGSRRNKSRHNKSRRNTKKKRRTRKKGHGRKLNKHK